MSPGRSRRHAFQDASCRLTLAEGLAQYYAENRGLKRGETLSPEAREFFRCHDAAHVVFGCGTSLRDEAVVKLSSIFGTTTGLAVLRGYALYDAQDIYRALSARDILAVLATAPVLVPRTVWRRLRQRRRWPWAEFTPFVDRPLNELRRSFGIIVEG